MTPASLEAARRLLFLSPPEAAALIGGVSEQAWRRWEAGTRAVPADVAARVDDLLAWRRQAIATAESALAELRGAPVRLIWYASQDDWLTLPGREPVTWRPHQSACAELASRHPGRIELIRFNGPAYAAWLAGRPDSETLRGVWAAHADD